MNMDRFQPPECGPEGDVSIRGRAWRRETELQLALERAEQGVGEELPDEVIDGVARDPRIEVAG